MSELNVTSTKKALGNITWLFGEKVITMGVALLISIVLARYLGVSDFGKLNYLISFIAILMPFSALGLNAIVVRELVNEKVNTGTILGTALLLRALGGLAAVVIVLCGCFILNKELLVSTNWLVLGAIGSGFSSLLLFDFYFQSIVQSQYVVKSRLIVLLLSSALKLLAIYYQMSLNLFLILVVLEPVFTGLLLYVFFNVKKNKLIKFKFDSNYAKELFSQSKWLILSGFMAIVYLKVDQIMIGEMLGSEELGIYSVAVRMSEVWYFFPTAIVASFFPKLLKSRVSYALYEYNLQRLCDSLCWLGIVVAIFITSISSLLINTLYGQEYNFASQVLNIHIWAGVFIFMRALLSKWLIAEGLLKFSLVTHGIAAVVNVVLNYIWIPQFGILGAAWATLIAYALSSYVVLWINRKTLPMAKIMTKTITFPYRLLKN
ncbi:flippase [Vibrio casei]|uniref:Flippase n=1 Tax=Vibrio casei TaxID=673372 RepID=A0A368LG29_9VIBR|nr:flippase [Vibrio casei]RCS69129.1 flippase [Vibrio casei]SJN37311.1 Membrane protein involved in the export of O-antigen, teichoic acid lipoteichoic acids [Vibrio casei]